jgi:hypothetical protein
MLLVSALLLPAMAAAFVLWPAGHASAPVINSSITGVVKDAQGLAVPGAAVTAVHKPSRTRYEAVTRSDGTFSIIAMRVGGPYTVKADLAGFQPKTADGVFLNLGVGMDLVLTLGTVAVVEEVTVVGKSDPVFASNRTGAATAISRETLETLPSIYGTLSSVTRLTPQSGGGMSFVGQDSKMNNITVDGSYLNNSFGLGNGVVGGKTGVAAISLSAIEQIQDDRPHRGVSAGFPLSRLTETPPLSDCPKPEARSTGRPRHRAYYDPSGSIVQRAFGAGGMPRRSGRRCSHERADLRPRLSLNDASISCVQTGQTRRRSAARVEPDLVPAVARGTALEREGRPSTRLRAARATSRAGARAG